MLVISVHTTWFPHSVPVYIYIHYTFCSLGIITAQALLRDQTSCKYLFCSGNVSLRVSVWMTPTSPLCEDFFPQTVTFMCLCNSLSSPTPLSRLLCWKLPFASDLRSFNPFSAFRTLYDVRRDLTGSANSPTRKGLISLFDFDGEEGSTIKKICALTCYYFLSIHLHIVMLRSGLCVLIHTLTCYHFMFIHLRIAMLRSGFCVLIHRGHCCSSVKLLPSHQPKMVDVVWW